MMVDLREWFGEDIANAFGVSGENENGRVVVDFCANRGLCMGNRYFWNKYLNKYRIIEREIC